MFVDISYSCGDRETPIEIPADRNNWDYMLELAIREMKEECRTHCGEGMASIIPTEDGIELHYMDGSVCQYELVENIKELDTEKMESTLSYNL